LPARAGVGAKTPTTREFTVSLPLLVVVNGGRVEPTFSPSRRASVVPTAISWALLTGEGPVDAVGPVGERLRRHADEHRVNPVPAEDDLADDARNNSRHAVDPVPEFAARQ